MAPQKLKREVEIPDPDFEDDLSIFGMLPLPVRIVINMLFISWVCMFLFHLLGIS